MFRWSELSELVTAAGGSVLASSASNWASLGDQATLERLAADPSHWNSFAENEIRLCAEPGIVDGGTHILLAARRDAAASPAAAPTASG